MNENLTVTLTQSPVELFKILKFEGIASSGAEAKLMIEQGLVNVNGETETRKRRKIVGGDIIQLDGIILTITE